MALQTKQEIWRSLEKRAQAIATRMKGRPDLVPTNKPHKLISSPIKWHGCRKDLVFKIRADIEKSKCYRLVELFSGSSIISVNARGLINKAYCNDNKFPLINFYQQLQDGLIIDTKSYEISSEYQARMLKEFQYQLLHKEDLASLAKAFYYLNRCSVNNLYRVNGEGNYTVCLKSPDKITKIPPIKITADDLSHITFTNKDYSEVYFPKKYTLIYADPPGFYPDSMESTRTLSRGFSTWKCQIKLLNFLARYIDTHPIIYTNVYSDRLYNVLRRAFTYYKLEILERPRHINPKGNTEPVKLIYAKNF